MKATQCTVDGCERAHHARSLCNVHYWQLWKKGTLEAIPETAVSDRLMAGLVRMPNGCLEWTKGTHNGYGLIKVGGKGILTHRLAWELTHGPIPDGLCVLHRCDNAPCSDVEHLWLGTKKDNNADRDAKGRQSNSKKVHCKRGHPFDAANTYIDAKGNRCCRACQKAAQIRYKDKKRSRGIG